MANNTLQIKLELLEEQKQALLQSHKDMELEEKIKACQDEIKKIILSIAPKNFEHNTLQEKLEFLEKQKQVLLKGKKTMLKLNGQKSHKINACQDEIKKIILSIVSEKPY